MRVKNTSEKIINIVDLPVLPDEEAVVPASVKGTPGFERLIELHLLTITEEDKEEPVVEEAKVEPKQEVVVKEEPVEELLTLESSETTQRRGRKKA